MNAVLERALNVSSETYKHFGDLVGFIGLFSLAMYVAAIQYFSAYNDQFYMRSAEIFDSHRVVVYFLTGAILDSAMKIVLLAALGALIALLFFVARTVLRPLYGYVLLCLMYIFVILLLAFFGNSEGRADGIREWLLTESSLPRVEISLHHDAQLNALMEEHMRAKGQFLLLSHNSDFATLLIPLTDREDPSVKKLIQIRNVDIQDIVIIQPGR